MSQQSGCHNDDEWLYGVTSSPISGFASGLQDASSVCFVELHSVIGSYNSTEAMGKKSRKAGKGQQGRGKHFVSREERERGIAESKLMQRRTTR